MSISEIIGAISAVKYIVPAIEEVVASAKVQLPQDKADIVAAIAAVEKAVGDLKGGFVALETVVKAAYVSLSGR